MSKYFSVDNTKKTGLYGYGYDFSVDYVDDILDIQCFGYSMFQMFWLIKQVFIAK